MELLYMLHLPGGSWNIFLDNNFFVGYTFNKIYR